MKKVLILLAAASGVGLGGCATIVEGNDQVVHFDTEPSGATCSISRSGEGLLYPSFKTPTSLNIEKDKDQLVVSCKKDGCREKVFHTNSNFEGWTLGNLVFGGIIGLGVDAASGALNEYPSHVQIPLNCESGGSASDDGGSSSDVLVPLE